MGAWGEDEWHEEAKPKTEGVPHCLWIGWNKPQFVFVLNWTKGDENPEEFLYETIYMLWFDTFQTLQSCARSMSPLKKIEEDWLTHTMYMGTGKDDGCGKKRRISTRKQSGEELWWAWKWRFNWWLLKIEFIFSLFFFVCLCTRHDLRREKKDGVKVERKCDRLWSGVCH